MDQFMGFVPTKNSVTTNYTGDRGTGILIQDESDRQGSFLEVAVSTILIVKNVQKTVNFTTLVKIKLKLWKLGKRMRNAMNFVFSCWME